MKSKETKLERERRIKETENGRRLYTKAIPNKKRQTQNKGDNYE